MNREDFDTMIVSAIKGRLEAIQLQPNNMRTLRVTVAINEKTGMVEKVFLTPEYEFTAKHPRSAN